MAVSEIVLWLIALCPIAALFISLTILKQSVIRSSFIALSICLFVLIGLQKASFDLGIETLGAAARTAANMLYAIWPAMILYECMKLSGAFDKMVSLFVRLTKDKLIQILLISWLFSSFLQAISGFGVPVAVCAPFLLALGVKPLYAIMLTLIGHSWANTYGTLGMAWLSLVELGPVNEYMSTALLTGIFLFFINLSGALLSLYLIGRTKAIKHGFAFVVLMSSIMGIGQLCTSLLSAQTAAFIPCVIALVVSLLLFRFNIYTKAWGEDGDLLVLDEQKEQQTDAPISLTCLYPFVLMSLACVLVFLVPAIREPIEHIQIAGIPLIVHAGFVLSLACLPAFIGLKKAEMRALPQKILKRLLPISCGIFLLVCLARLLELSGLITILAEGSVAFAGKAYIPFASLLGTFGAFISSSNMSSNILFAHFQEVSALSLGISPALLLAAQTAGGAAGSILGPSTILLGISTVGLKGKEGIVLSKLVKVALLQSLCIGIACLLIYLSGVLS